MFQNLNTGRALTKEEVRQVGRTTETIRTATATIQRLLGNAIEDQVLPPNFKISIAGPGGGESASIVVTCIGDERCIEAANTLQAKGCGCSSIEGGTECVCP